MNLPSTRANIQREILIITSVAWEIVVAVTLYVLKQIYVCGVELTTLITTVQIHVTAVVTTVE